MPGIFGKPNSRIASRPPGPQHAREFPARRRGIDHVADAERDHRGVERGIGQRQAGRIAARQVDARRERRRPDLLEREAQHLAGEVDADDLARLRPGAASTASIARSAVPVHTSSTRSVPVSASARRRAGASGGRSRR